MEQRADNPEIPFNMEKNMEIIIPKPVKSYKLYLQTTNFLHILDRHGSYFTWYSVDKGIIFRPFSTDKGGFVILPAAHPYQKLSKHPPGSIGS